jgi:hypothetical protein
MKSQPCQDRSFCRSVMTFYISGWIGFCETKLLRLF